MANYSQLAARLDSVRWAWKRTAAFSGLAILLIEALGIFTVLLLVDVIYRPEPQVRLGASLMGLAAVVALFFRHVLRPLLRRIPDRQLALYVEEHNDHFEGALMTAAEFGPRADGAAPAQGKMVRAVIEAAARRAEREDPRRAVVLARLRKYGRWAIAVVAAYAAAFLLLREQVSASARHVLMPLNVTTEETQRQQEGPAGVKPIELRLSSLSPPMRPDGSIRLPRGGSVPLEVVLSRASQQPVFLNYRVAAEAAAPTAPWQRLEMQSVDKVNTLALLLSDIDTDLEVFASTGPYESPRHRIGVYEPLVLHGSEITVRFPDYMQLPDRIEAQANGDVVAPVGSKATVRLVTNRPLAAATITWADGRAQPAAPDPAKPEDALFTFDVTADTTYTFALVDADAQQIGSPSPCIVHAVPDGPPTIVQQTPASSPLPVHPLAEINFTAEAGDDFGLAGVDLVYLPQTDIDAKEVRVPLEVQLPEGAPAAARVPVRCVGRFALEDLVPRLPPGTTISYFLEARDRNPNGQRAVTNLSFITVMPFEVWAALGGPHEPEDSIVPEKTLEELIRGVWEVHGKRGVLPPAEFNKQTEHWANWMLDEKTGKVLPLVVLPHGMKPTPERMLHVEKGNAYCVQAHAALAAHDTDRAVKLLRFALGEQVLVGFDTTASAALPSSGAESGAGAVATLQSMRVEADVLAKLDKPDKKAAQDDSEAAKEAKKEASDMKKDQEKIIGKATGPKPDDKNRNKATDQKPEEDAAGEKPAGSKSEAKKPGAKTKGKKSGEQKAKDEMSAASKPEGEKPDGEKTVATKPDGEKPDGAKPAGAKPEGASGKELAAEQTKLAGRAKAAAVATRQTGSERLKKVADKFDEAAHKMTLAANLFAEGEKLKGADRAKDAKTVLEKAEDELGTAGQDGLEGAITRLQDRAKQIQRRQKDLREKGQQVAEDMPDGSAPNARQQRDLKGALAGQLRLKLDLEKFSADLADLDKQAKTGAKRETAKHVADALRDLQRGRADQKATNAAVQITANRPAAAAQEQKAVEEAVRKTAAGLENAENTLASDWKSEARRAKREADAVRGTASALAAASPNATQRKDLADDAADQAARLAKHVANRDLADQKDAAALGKLAVNPARLATDLAASRQKLTALTEIVQRISNHIEAEMQAKIDAEKLFSAQREECPPQYRDLVNKYYEALSKVKKP